MRMATIISVTATTLAAVVLTPQWASAERVCHRVCDNGICRERCVDRAPGVEIRTEGRGHHHRHGWREHHRGPGFEFRAPGVDVDIGR
jgi:hypothetical protein